MMRVLHRNDRDGQNRLGDLNLSVPVGFASSAVSTDGAAMGSMPKAGTA